MAVFLRDFVFRHDGHIIIFALGVRVVAVVDAPHGRIEIALDGRQLIQPAAQIPHALHNFVIIFFFCCGAAIGAFLTEFLSGGTLWVCSGMLFFTLLMLITDE